MITVELDKDYIEQEFKAELKKRLDELESQKVFWDIKELSEKTSMSISHLKSHLIYEPGFPRYKVGKKQVFPVKETQEYLLKWVKENG